MTPTQVRKVMAGLLAEGELPAADPDRLMVELYLHNGLTQRAIGELTGWNVTSVNQRLSQWLEDVRRTVVDYDTMRAHSGYNCFSDYYVCPSSFPRPSSSLPLSTEQTQRANALRLRRAAQGRPRRHKARPLVRDERWLHAEELLAVWPG
jgi:hypothetical protein